MRIDVYKRQEMQYAAVWLEDGSGIIQIGMEPRRLLEKLEEKILPNIISMMPFEMKDVYKRQQ